ncbi:MAG: hypothetical protein DRM97_08045, partial [Thermoprotei archaeon]
DRSKVPSPAPAKSSLRKERPLEKCKLTSREGEIEKATELRIRTASSRAPTLLAILLQLKPMSSATTKYSIVRSSATPKANT